MAIVPLTLNKYLCAYKMSHEYVRVPTGTFYIEVQAYGKFFQLFHVLEFASTKPSIRIIE